MRGIRFLGVAVVSAVFGVSLLLPNARADADLDRSPAVCGPTDNAEPGIQGEVPRGEEPNYECGLTLLGELPSDGGAVQGNGHCAYVRHGGAIRVVDVSDPRNPVELRSVPVFATGRPQVGGNAEHGSETMRAVVTKKRAVLVSGGTVYDIRDCENPVFKGQIAWPNGVYEPGGAAHDIRISKDATTVYATFGLKEANISDLDDPSTWTVRDHACGIEAQLSDQPLSPVHGAAAEAGINLCDHGYVAMTGTGQLSHGPETNEGHTRVYIGAQSNHERTLTLLDATTEVPRVISRVPATPGHGIDWFRTPGGGEYLLSSNELGGPGILCAPQPPSNGGASRREAAGGEAYLTDITDETKPKRASVVEIAINKPENCLANLASGASAFMGYHSVDNPLKAHFAMIAWGTAGLRVFDIRSPENSAEVAYFNHGGLVHAGATHYDADRGIMYVPHGEGLKVVGVQPHIFDQLGMKQPVHPWWRTPPPTSSRGSETPVR